MFGSLVEKGVHVGARYVPFDLKLLPKSSDQLLTACSLQKGRPEQCAALRDREIYRLTKIQSDDLTLYLAPLERTRP